jgi:hypothetical protein
MQVKDACYAAHFELPQALYCSRTTLSRRFVLRYASATNARFRAFLLLML